MYRQQPFHIDLNVSVHKQYCQINIAVDLHISSRNTPQVGGNRILVIGAIAYGGCLGHISSGYNLVKVTIARSGLYERSLKRK